MPNGELPEIRITRLEEGRKDLEKKIEANEVWLKELDTYSSQFSRFMAEFIEWKRTKEKEISEIWEYRNEIDRKITTLEEKMNAMEITAKEIKTSVENGIAKVNTTVIWSIIIFIGIAVVIKIIF